jgi:hypothetical protein
MLGPFLDVEMFKKCRPCGTEHISKWQNTSGPAHFWQLRCWKSARCCGAKHMSKSKLEKHHHDMLGPLFRRSRHDKNNYNYITHYITLHYATTSVTTTTTTPLHLLHYNSNYITLHYTTLHSVFGWGDHCSHSNRWKRETPTTFRSISGFGLPSMHHNISQHIATSHLSYTGWT